MSWQFEMHVSYIYTHTHTHYKTLVKMAFKILKNGLRTIDLRNLEKHEAENRCNKYRIDVDRKIKKRQAKAKRRK